MNKKDIEQFNIFLSNQGFKKKEIDIIIKNYEKNNLTFNNLIDNFVKQADKDPHSITNKNCESGKCNAWQIDKEGN